MGSTNPGSGARASRSKVNFTDEGSLWKVNPHHRMLVHFKLAASSSNRREGVESFTVAEMKDAIMNELHFPKYPETVIQDAFSDLVSERWIKPKQRAAGVTAYELTRTAKQAFLADATP